MNKSNKILKGRQICLDPFEKVEIYDNGDVCCCWNPYLVNGRKFKFGNIFEQSFDDIWNGEIAQQFRKDIINEKYSVCQLDLCCSDGLLPYYTKNKKGLSVIAPYPTCVIFSIDHSCNQMCRMCRDIIECNQKETVEKLNSIIDDKLLPILKNAKIFYPCDRGELFASKHSRKLVKAATKMYPDLRYCIYTNGLLCNEENIKDLGIYGKIDKLLISVHAITENTYNKVVKGGNFKKVIENVKYCAKEQAKGHIGEITLNFVVSSLNYFEMAEFAEFAKSLNVLASFWEFRDWQTSEMCKNYDKYAIVQEEHPEHSKLVEMLQNPIFHYKWVWLNDILKQYCKTETKAEAKKRMKKEDEYEKLMGFDKHTRINVCRIY